MYLPRLKLSFVLVPQQYTPAPVPFPVLEPSVYQIRPLFCQVGIPYFPTYSNGGFPYTRTDVIIVDAFLYILDSK
jgi:hypothetical protein